MQRIQWNLSNQDTNGAEESVIDSEVSSLTLGAHAQGLRYLLCVCVGLSVTALAASASAYTCSQRYSGVCHRLFLDIYVWIFEKTFRSKVMA